MATELACRNLPVADKSQLRAKIASVLKSSKPPESKISKDERKAIKQLQRVEEIIILPADKGKATCILDRTT